MKKQVDDYSGETTGNADRSKAVEKEDLEKAVEAWVTIYREDPENDWARDELKKLYYKSEKWNALNDMLRGELDSLPEDAWKKRIEILKELLEINQNHLFADEMVINKYHRAIFELDPTDMAAQEAFEKICRKEGQWGDLAKILADRIEKAADPKSRVELLHELANLWIYHLRDMNGAASSFEEILRIDPNDKNAREGLKSLYRKQKSWRPLLRILEKEMESLEGEAKLKVLLKIEEIVSKHLSDTHRAFKLWWRVLEIDPQHEKSLASIEQFTARNKDWDGFSKIMEFRISKSKSENERTSYLYKLGALFGERLDDSVRAADVWQQVLLLNPDDKRAQRSLRESYITAQNWPELENLYIDDGNYKGLAETLGRAAEKSEEPETKKKLLTRCIELYEGPIKKPDRAIHYYKRLFSIDPKNERAALMLAPVFRSRKQWEDLFDVVSINFERQASLAGIEDDKEVLESLEPIAREREAWPELVEIKKRILIIEDLSEVKWFTVNFEIGTILDEQLGKRGEAIKIFSEGLKRFKGDLKTISVMQHFLYDAEHQLEAAQILMPHLVANDNWSLEAKAISILIESTLNADTCLELQLQLADIYSKKGDDPYLAFDVLGTALKEHPANRELWDRLTTLADKLDLSEKLAEGLKEAYRSWQLDDESEAELAERLAGILDDRLDRPAEAEEFHRRVLESDPTNKPSFQFLMNLCVAEERWDELIRLYEDALVHTTDKNERLELLDKLCIIVDDVLHHVPKAIEAYRSILNLDPGNLKAVRALSDLYEEDEKWEDLYLLISSQMKTIKGKNVIALNCRLAEIDERFLGRPLVALERYKKILINSPDNLRALKGLERLVKSKGTRLGAAGILKHIYWKQKKLEPLARMLVIELDNNALKTDERLTLLSQLAALREKHLGDALGALKTYTLALTVAPGNLKIRSELARLAEKLGTIERYALVLEEVSHKVEGNREVAAQLLSEAARVYLEELGDVSQAEKINRRLLGIAPSNSATVLRAVDLLENVFEDRKAWPDLCEVLRIKVVHTKVPSEKKEILHRIAGIERSKTNQTLQAISTFKEILDIDKKDMRAVLELERLLEHEERWLELIELLRLRSSLEPSSRVRREISLRISQLATRIGR